MKSVIGLGGILYAVSAMLTILNSISDGLVTDVSTVFDSVDIPRPEYLKSIIDPVFGSRITRVTGDPGLTRGGVNWGDRARHHYSKDQPWNADQSLLMIFNNGKPSTLILDGETYQLSFALDFPRDEIRWHPQNPNLLIYTKGNKL